MPPRMPLKVWAYKGRVGKCRQQKTRTGRASCGLSGDADTTENERWQGRNRTNRYRPRSCWACVVRQFVDAPKNAPKTKSTPHSGSNGSFRLSVLLACCRLLSGDRNLNRSTLETVPGRLISVDCFSASPLWATLGCLPVTLAKTLLCRLALIVRLRHRLTVTLPCRLAVILGLPRPNLAPRLTAPCGHQVWSPLP